MVSQRPHCRPSSVTKIFMKIMFALWLYRKPLKAFFFPLGKWGFPDFHILPRLKDGPLAPNPIRDNNVHSKRAFVILLFWFNLILVWNSWGVSPYLIPQEVSPKPHHIHECFTANELESSPQMSQSQCAKWREQFSPEFNFSLVCFWLLILISENENYRLKI